MKKHEKIFVLTAFVLTIGLFGIVESCNNEPDNTPEGPSGGGKSVTVDIYSFTDFHGVMDSSEDPWSNPGAARFIAVAKHLMSESEPGHSLLLSAGDNYHNWQYEDKGLNLSNEFRGKPVSDMFKIIGLKYSVIGNHEWDWGEKFDEYSSEAGGMTYLAANLFIKDTDTRPGFCEPYVIETIAGKKIGIVGITIVNMDRFTEDMEDEHYIDGYDFWDVDEAGHENWLKDLVADLRTNQGCDAVIALTHLEDESSDKLIGEYDKGFDAIILGHTHRTADYVSGGVPVVQAAHYGRGLSKLSFIFDDNGMAEIKHEIFGERNLIDKFSSSKYLQTGVIDEEIAAMVAYYDELRSNK